MYCCNLDINTYAGYAGGNTNDFVLKDMEVTVDVADGEDLTIGIKTSNQRNNGIRSTNDNAGWFKVDFFRIHQLSSTDVGQVRRKRSKDSSKLYTLNGIPIKQPRKGIYVQGDHKIFLK